MPGGSSRRMTRQRAAVLDTMRGLREAGVHPTSDEVYMEVRKVIPRISLATVYRNLYVLSEEGQIQRVETGGGAVRFDGDPSPHLHVRCVRCGKLEDLGDVELKVGSLAGVEARGYRVLGVRAEVLGVCEACAGNRAGGLERENLAGHAVGGGTGPES